MVVLNKLKASTLVETLVATVIIITIFLMATVLLNQLFIYALNNSHRDLDTEINKLEYRILNNKIKTPYFDNFNDWGIKIYKNKNAFLIEAMHLKTNKKVSRVFEK